MKYLSAKFNMASRKVLAPKLYKKFLQVCEQWPVDQNRLGRDFGEHLKGSLVPRIKKSEIDVSDVSCHRQKLIAYVTIIAKIYFIQFTVHLFAFLLWSTFITYFSLI